MEILVYPLHDPLQCFSLLGGSNTVNVISGTSAATHISLLNAMMVATCMTPYYEFCNPVVHTRKLLWSLPTFAPSANFRIRYYDFMMTGALGWNGTRF